MIAYLGLNDDTLTFQDIKGDERYQVLITCKSGIGLPTQVCTVPKRYGRIAEHLYSAYQVAAATHTSGLFPEIEKLIQESIDQGIEYLNDITEGRRNEKGDWIGE